MRRRRLLAAIAAVAAVPAAARAATRTSSSDPYPGIHREEWQDAAIPAVIHVARVDLTSSEVQVVATAAAGRGTTTSAAAAALGAQLAVNGDYFAVATFTPAGLAMGDGAVWPGTADDARSGFLAFGRVGERTTAAISPPSAVVAATALDPSTQGVVSGRPLLLAGGAPPASFDCADADAEACVRAPRTAVALSADGNTLWLVVVDGWQPASAGMTAAELAAFAQQLGASDALALDGGSASTMVVSGAVVSAPSDGVERAVANHLAVRYGALPKGQLVGFIREDDVFTGKDIAGALVTLDDGRQQTVGTSAMYDFTGVTPRLACATASASGYHSASRCVQVVSGQINYDSIALRKNSEFIDAGPGAPDAPPAPDAAPAVDAGGDGGHPLGGDGGGPAPGGCCDAGGASLPPLAPALALALALRWRRGRRAPRGR